MAERKLNINAPLLSVRRFSMKSYNSKAEDEKAFGSSTPSRRHNVMDQVTEPVAVPFQWEQIPGRRKGGNEPAPELVEEASVTPRLPPGRVSGNEVYDQFEDRHRLKALCLSETVFKLNGFEEGMNEKEGGTGSDENDGNGDSDSFWDPLDTLSMTYSFSVTCSASGVSIADVTSSRRFSTDVQTRDFMMRRFLPAAKAMTLQPTQYAVKKQPMAPQEPRQDKMMVMAVRRPPSPVKHGGVTIPHYGQEKGEEEEEEESEDQNQDGVPYDAGSVSAKGCGLFARLCLKSSLHLFNPVPGMKVRTRALVPPKEVERPIKAPPPTIKRDVPYKHKSGELPKLPKKDVFYKHNSGELPKLTQRVTNGSKRFSYSGNLQTMGRLQLSPSRRSGGISPYRREAPQSPFRGSGFLGIPKEAESFKIAKLDSAKRVDLRTKQGSVTPTAEKTLYVDTVSTAEMLCSDLKQMDSADGFSGFSFQEVNISKSLEQDQEKNLLECTKPEDSEDLKISNNQNPKEEDFAIVKVAGSVPPLPKSPSESWLWRALPPVNVQSSHSRTQFLKRKKQDIVKPHSPNTKWETIVKTSNPRHDHARYSQELIDHPSQEF